MTLLQEPTANPHPTPGVLTVADLALHEGGWGQASADGIAEAALGVQALAGAALGQRSGAQVHVLSGRLWATEIMGDQLREPGATPGMQPADFPGDGRTCPISPRW